MKCANPLCQHRLLYLRGGTLRLLELERPREGDGQEDGAGFSVRRAAARYFWLCPECSRILVLRRWTQEGIVLESRTPRQTEPPLTWTVTPEPALDVESILHFRRRPARSA